jgi:hypothetical protein
MKVVGRVTNGSVSFEAIHMKRGERSWLVVSLPDLTKCQRGSESALAQPTQEPVDPWSLMVHQVVRRSLEVGIVAVAAAISDFAASSKVQSSSVFGGRLAVQDPLLPARLGRAAAGRLPRSGHSESPP